MNGFIKFSLDILRNLVYNKYESKKFRLLEVFVMLAELRTKSQITLPKEIVNSLGLSEGDKLDIREKDGVIYLTPVTVYPKKYVDELQTEISELKKNIASGKQPTFDSIDALIERLESDNA